MRSRIVLALLVVQLAAPMALAQDGAAAKDPRNYTWVEEGVLAVGGGGLTEPDVDWLAANGFGAIADFRAEHKDPESYILSKNMTFLDMPIESAADINETQLSTFVAWAREQKAAGRVIYIHCTNGWHRAAAFAVAYEMATEGGSFDHEGKEAMQRRPGTVMRAVAGLLDYEASLTHEPQLAVVLVSPLPHPGLNGTMPVSVDVYADGLPAANAKVRVWSEESKIRKEGVTDANGRFTFDYVAPADAFMDHLYARAALDGYADGADNVEFIFAQTPGRGALDVATERTPEGLRVRATSDGKAIPIRVVANAPGFSEFEASARGEVLIRDAPLSAIDIRVVAWGSTGGSATLGAIAPPPAPPPAPEPVEEAAPPQPEPPPPEEVAPEVVPPETPNAPAQPEPSAPAAQEPGAPAPVSRGHTLALRYAAAAVACAALLGLYVALSRRRSGVGRR